MLSSETHPLTARSRTMIGASSSEVQVPVTLSSDRINTPRVTRVTWTRGGGAGGGVIMFFKASTTSTSGTKMLTGVSSAIVICTKHIQYLAIIKIMV